MPIPFIPVLHTASVELIFQNGAYLAENCFHVQWSDNFGPAQLTGVRNIFIAWDSATGRTGRVPGWALTRVRSKALHTSSGAIEDYTLPSPQAGTAGGSTQANNVTYAVKFQTGLAGRSQRGRIYVVGLSTTAMASPNGVVSTTAAAGFVSSYNTLIANLISAGYNLVVTSFRHDGAYRAEGQNSIITTAAVTDSYSDSMRRRLPGRGM
jgi:hypothetical protein